MIGIRIGGLGGKGGKKGGNFGVTIIAPLVSKVFVRGGRFARERKKGGWTSRIHSGEEEGCIRKRESRSSRGNCIFDGLREGKRTKPCC